MTSILDDAATIVAEREYLYDLVMTDCYFMAQLSGDQETQDHIWQEAWDQGNNRLIMLLMLVETGLNYGE